MQAFWTQSDCLDALTEGIELLLPTAAAADRLRHAFDSSQRALGRRAWQPARVWSSTQWTHSLWSDLIVSGSESRILLNTAQELQLWREVIASDNDAQQLTSAESLAELCRSAWAMACSFRCTADLRSAATSHDNRVFAGWADQFLRRCKAWEWLPPAALEGALAEHLRAGQITLTGGLHLIGFDQLTPAQTDFLQAARDKGSAVHMIGLDAGEQSGRRRLHAVASDEPAQWTAAARWVRSLLSGPRSSASVAVLLPGPVDAVRGQLEPVFREILTPELQDIDLDLSSTPWTVSGGPALASVSVVRDLLELARWCCGALPAERIGPLLLSPYFSQGGDPDAHAVFEARGLRRASTLLPEYDLVSFLGLARRFAARMEGKAPAGWTTGVADLAASSGTSDWSVERSYAEWTEFLRGLAQAAGWPGNRALSANEFQATRGWDSVLDLVATLDIAGRRVTFGEALAEVERAARSIPFSPPAPFASIHVLSMTESEGQFFDAAVILNASDMAWPAPESLNPLLGSSLQRRLRMPGADPVETAARARAQAESLLLRCPDVVVLHAAQDRNGPARPSTLIDAMEFRSRPLDELIAPQEEVASVVEELVPDTDALPGLPVAEIHGGSSLLKLQAACGFLAFAELRLGCTELETPSSGLDARQSGQIVHTVLQLFWKQVATQENLRSMSQEGRSALLSRCIREALDKAPRPHGSWEEAYLAVITERLQRLLLGWLEQELLRAPFTVLGQEHSIEVAVGPLTLRVRVDRVDRVDDGVLFVDYKTGFGANPTSWEGPRPDEPQLPLYALLAEAAELRGLAFARVRAGGQKSWSGYVDRAGLLPKKGSKVVDLEEYAAAWRETLAALAYAFYDGRVDVHPKNFAVNCSRCAQRLLCRVNPALFLNPEEEEDVEEVAEADG